MKEYLVGTKYTQVEKDLIMKVARYLYSVYDVGRRNNGGWNVCDDDDRRRAISCSLGIYSEAVKPYATRITHDTEGQVKDAIIKCIES